jgi:histidyl-tRNA synthetase
VTAEDGPGALDEELRSPRGTHDVLPPDSARWEALVAQFATLAERHGFGLAHTPMFEDARVFRRGIGEASEVVGKEMYEFDDRSGRHLALRPEGTASIVRAFVQHRPPVPWRVWYVTPAFRYEQPQAGRYRQHHQLGVEVLGSEDPDVDVEVIALAHDLYADLGLRSVSLRVNSLGDTTCRPAYLVDLTAFLEGVATELCDEHRATWRRNPLRILDCKP